MTAIPPAMKAEISSVLRRHPKKLTAAAVLAAASVLVSFAGSGGGSEGSAAGGVYAAARRGPMTVSIDEGGTIVSRERVTVPADLTQDTSFLWLIEEGTVVAKGDLIAELDDTVFVNRKEDEDLRLIANRSELARAENDMKVTLNENESMLSRAEVDLTLAEMDLRKFKDGEHPQKLKELETNIGISEEELQRAEDKLTWSKKLHEPGYITRTELQADELAENRGRVKLELARGAKEIYENYTAAKEIERLTLDVEQKRLALERVRHSIASREQFALTRVENQKTEIRRREAWIRKTEKDIANCKVAAPADGMVIYASTVRSGGHYNEPFVPGRGVGRRQDLFYLTSAGAWNVELSVQESQLEMVGRGLPVRVRAEAVPGSGFTGKVTDIGVMPNQTNPWADPNLKVFDVKAELDTGEAKLRTGMSCLVEIIVHEYEDVVQVPVQAVVRQGDRALVHVRGKNGPVPRVVETGHSNNRMTAVLSGLVEGEEVLLTPPLRPEGGSSEATGEDVLAHR